MNNKQIHKPFLDWKWNRFRIPRQRELVKVYFGRYVIKIGQKCTPMHFWDSHDLSWPHSDHLYHHCSSNFWIIVFHTLFSWRKFIFQSMPPSTTLRYPLRLVCKIRHLNESKGPCMLRFVSRIGNIEKAISMGFQLSGQTEKKIGDVYKQL